MFHHFNTNSPTPMIPPSRFQDSETDTPVVLSWWTIAMITAAMLGAIAVVAVAVQALS